jgi:hypothetical protein
MSLVINTDQVYDATSFRMPILDDFFHREAILGLGCTVQARVDYQLMCKHPYEGDVDKLGD